MKKSAILSAGLAILTLLASCEKEKKQNNTENTKPVISWEANAKFEQQEIRTGMDAVVSLEAKEGVSVFTLKFTKVPDDLRGVVKQHIGNNANRTGANSDTPILDPVDDATVASYFKGLGLPGGSSIQGATSLSFDFKLLLDDILKNQVLDNNSQISILLTLVDKADQSISKTVTFHYTSGPEIKWSANPDFAVVDLGSASKVNASLSLTVPGKVEKVTMTVTTASATLSGALKAYVSSTATPIVVDLTDDAKAVESFAGLGVATGSALKGKTSATLDLTNFVITFVKPFIASDSPNTYHNFDVKVADQFGKEESKTLSFTLTTE